VLCRDPRSLALKLSLVLVAVCPAASTVLSTPQQTTSQSAENKQTAPPLRVTAHLVQANVIVNDKHGNPITGLSQKDFTILDKGSQQEIRVFAAQTNLPSVPSRITPLPLGTYTNRPEEQTNIPASITIILLDALNTEPADRVLARKQVIRVLQHIQPQEYVALYWLGDGLHVLHDFTTDASVLRQVLAGYDDKPNHGADDSDVADPSLIRPTLRHLLAQLPSAQPFAR
jgi:VWFA-related protein